MSFLELDSPLEMLRFHAWAVRLDYLDDLSAWASPLYQSAPASTMPRAWVERGRPVPAFGEPSAIDTRSGLPLWQLTPRRMTVIPLDNSGNRVPIGDASGALVYAPPERGRAASKLARWRAEAREPRILNDGALLSLQAVPEVRRQHEYSRMLLGLAMPRGQIDLERDGATIELGDAPVRERAELSGRFLAAQEAREQAAAQAAERRERG